MRSSLWITAFAASLLAMTVAEGAKLYRWVDEEGNVHYTDKIPTDQVERGRDELSNRGVRKRSVPRAKTQEEVEKERELQRLRAEQKRLIAEQKAADRVLLRTFRSEDDIIMAREGKLTAIDVQIQIAQGNIRRNQRKLSEMQHRAATSERSGKIVPNNLTASIDKTLHGINDTYAAIERKEQQKKSIRERFNGDLDRFRELKKLVSAEPAALRAKPLPLPNVLECADDSSCDRAWSRVEPFVRKHATTRMQMIADFIVMTAVPAEPDQIGVTISRIHDKRTQRTVLFLDVYCKQDRQGKAFCKTEAARAIRRAFRSEVGAAAAQ